jgi:hypothetical protein
MNPGNIKIIDRLSAVETIKRLNEEGLRFLNNLIVERFNLISQARAISLITRFTKSDRITFTASDSHHWNVSPSLIREAGNIQWP